MWRFPLNRSHADVLLTNYRTGFAVELAPQDRSVGAMISKKTICRETASVRSRLNASEAPARHFAVLLIMTK
jgi:hypothetical protein